MPWTIEDFTEQFEKRTWPFAIETDFWLERIELLDWVSLENKSLLLERKPKVY